MLNFRLQVFYTSAKRLNFTKAASELFITQPAVTKNIHELEKLFKTKLFDRKGNTINLTLSGKRLLEHTEKLMNLYKELEFDMNALSKRYSGVLKIGASTTIAQYIIPEILAQFHSKFEEVKIHLISGNTEQIERALTANEIDLGIVEGRSRNSQINYINFVNDEIVLVSNSEKVTLNSDFLTVDELKNYPLLLREPGSGTLEVIVHALKDKNIKLSDLKIEMQLGNTESIKSYLQNSSSLAFISIYSILKELKHQELRIIDIEDFSIIRPFYFIQKQGEQGSLSLTFINFCISYNLR